MPKNRVEYNSTIKQISTDSSINKSSITVHIILKYAYQIFSPHHGEVLAVKIFQSVDANVGQKRVGVVTEVYGVLDGNFVSSKVVGFCNVIFVLSYDVHDGVKRVCNGITYLLFLDIFVVIVVFIRFEQFVLTVIFFI